MSRLFIGNIAFEQAWDPGYNLPQSVQRLEAERAWIWLPLASEGDEILTPVPFSSEDWGRFESLGCPRVRPVSLDEAARSKAEQIVPWGWTPAIRQLAARSGIEVQAPDQEIVWRVNSRAFGWEMSQQAGDLLAGEGLAHSMEELEKLLAGILRERGRWVAKPNHGQAGKGQLRGSAMPEGKTRATLARMIQRGGVVHVEPELEPVMEVGVQWEIRKSGQFDLIGLTRLFTDQKGVYSGTGLGVELPEPQLATLLQRQRRALSGLSSAGYFGPVGIDAMVFHGENGTGVRAVQDINARWTMGRIAWEWGQFARNSFCNPPSGKEPEHPGTVSVDHGLSQLSPRLLPPQGIWWTSVECPGPDAIPLSPETLNGTPVRNRIWWRNSPQSEALLPGE